MPDASLIGTILVENRPVRDLVPDERNARQHSPEQVNQIAHSIRRFGWTIPILADDKVRAGHGRRLAALQIYAEGDAIFLPNGEELPAGTVPVMDCSGWTEEQKRAYMIADNQLTIAGEWDEAILREEIDALLNMGIDPADLGFSQAELEAMRAVVDDAGDEARAQAKNKLSDEFLIAPFSVLNAREGWWQDRKRAWIGLGIESELGRGANVIGRSLPDRLAMIIPGRYAETAAFIDKHRAKGWEDDQIEAEAIQLYAKEAIPGGAGKNSVYRSKGFNATPGGGGTNRRGRGGSMIPYAKKGAQQKEGATGGTSIFDPVLCELAYRWFCPPAGLVLDPFAGGSVRGIVAGMLERLYVGVDLRPEQCEANRIQADRIFGPDAGFIPQWIEGDSRHEIETALSILAPKCKADFLFSCPPYGDLEVYSDDPSDLSNLDPADFDAAYREIIAASLDLLKDDRFACFVVGDYRDKRGLYRNFVSKTIEAFQLAGAQLYNEAILVTATGSLAIRAGKTFRATRKLGKTHQNILVFVKGDPRRATEACGPVNVEAALSGFDEIIDEGPMDEAETVRPGEGEAQPHEGDAPADQPDDDRPDSDAGRNPAPRRRQRQARSADGPSRPRKSRAARKGDDDAIS